jgi:PhnB protein
MSTNIEFKPKNYNSVSPYFVVNSGQKFIDLMKTIFDGTLVRRFNHDNGTIYHGEIKIDDSIIMFADSSEQYPPNTLVMHVYVANVDETFTKAIDAGCEIIEKPNTKPNETDRRGTFKDFAGNIWSIGTQQGSNSNNDTEKKE